VREVTRDPSKSARGLKLSHGLANSARVALERVGERARGRPHQAHGRVNAAKSPQEQERALCQGAELGEPADAWMVRPPRGEQGNPVVGCECES